jgi:hypothetical protein
MSETPQPPLDPTRLEGYFVELLDKLERIASVMERFDNIMNPTLGMAEAELDEQIAASDVASFPSIFLQPVKPGGPSAAAQQVG